MTEKALPSSQVLIEAFGGQSNISNIDACLTRLRITVNDSEAVEQDTLKQLGAIGVVYADGVVQAIFGKDSDTLRAGMQDWIQSHPEAGIAGELISAFGGKLNIKRVDACLTRLRVTVKETDNVDSEKLKGLGALGVVVLNNNVQAIFGKQSDNLKQEITSIIST